MSDYMVISDLEVNLEHENQVNIRKLWCDVYSSQMKKHGESRLAKVEASNATMSYVQFFKPDLFNKAPEGAKE